LRVARRITVIDERGSGNACCGLQDAEAVSVVHDADAALLDQVIFEVVDIFLPEAVIKFQLVA
jgi:hypothetical protein